MKKLFIYGFGLLLASWFSGCSDDNLGTANDSQPLEKDQTFFANISICNVNSMTRVDNDYVYDNSGDPEFDKGTDVENKINSVYLIFYDVNGNRVSTTQIRKDNNNNFDNWGLHNSGDIIYKGVVQIDVDHGSLKPACVMCFINPITSTNFEINPDFETLERLKSTTRPSIIDKNEFFAMSKSVYWKEYEYAENNSLIVTTPLDVATNLFETEEAAKAALDKEQGIVDIYVERYAAKVALEISLKDEDNQAIKNPNIKIDNDYSLEFYPEYWAVNAYESETYICKSFLSSDMKTQLTYSELENSLKGKANKVWKWNNPEYHRCYWAQSPAYYASKYPRDADDLKENTDEYGQNDYILGYYSYNDIVKNADKSLIAKSRILMNDENNKETYTAIYARENTVSGNSLKKAAEDPLASPKAAIASAVIVGHYNLKKNEKNIDTEMFYIMGNATNGYTVFENTNSMMDYFIRTTIKFATDDNQQLFFDYDKGKFISGMESYRKYFTVVHPYKASRVNSYDEENREKHLVIDSRFVTIQLTEQAKNATDLYVFLNGRYQPVTPENFDEVNKQMLYAAGTTQGFNQGKVFYNIPIKHLGFYRDGNENAGKSGTETTFDWTKCQSGDFGLVRNHSYNIKVTTIKGLGNGIPDPDDPIVPPTDPEEYYIGARIIVLNWALVPTQEVEL